MNEEQLRAENELLHAHIRGLDELIAHLNKTLHTAVAQLKRIKRLEEQVIQLQKEKNNGNNNSSEVRL